MFTDVVVPDVEFLDDEMDAMRYAERCERMGRISHRTEDRVVPCTIDVTGGDRPVRWGSCDRFLRNYAVEMGHQSILRHGVLAVVVTCSRACSHQVVRHHAGFDITQESQRYCVYKDGIRVICPPSMRLPAGRYEWRNSATQSHTDEAGRVDATFGANAHQFLDAVSVAYAQYHEMIKFGVTPEDARYLLPNATATTLAITANGEAWRHFLNVRALDQVGKAQWEVKGIAATILEQFASLLPMVFGDLWDQWAAAHL